MDIDKLEPNYSAVDQSEPKIDVLDHGYVRLVDHMGSDQAIVDAARVSYGKGTTSMSKDRNLIRYLLRMKHTSPFEMCEVKFHIKLPIFVMRQHIRHRTASVNEYSARYSILEDEFYIPNLDYIQPQSTNNKQGREEGGISDNQKKAIQQLLDASYQSDYKLYQLLLGEESVNENTDIRCSHFSDEYPGLSRELARLPTPVSIYTQCYWKIDLHNLFHYLRLRLDPHAQKEIRDFAEAMYKLIRPLFPLSVEAFDDYILGSKTFSRMELDILQKLLEPIKNELTDQDLELFEQKMSKREVDSFVKWLYNK